MVRSHSARAPPKRPPAKRPDPASSSNTFTVTEEPVPKIKKMVRSHSERAPPRRPNQSDQIGVKAQLFQSGTMKVTQVTEEPKPVVREEVNAQKNVSANQIKTLEKLSVASRPRTSRRKSALMRDRMAMFGGNVEKKDNAPTLKPKKPGGAPPRRPPKKPSGGTEPLQMKAQLFQSGSMTVTQITESPKPGEARILPLSKAKGRWGNVSTQKVLATKPTASLAKRVVKAADAFEDGIKPKNKPPTMQRLNTAPIKSTTVIRERSKTAGAQIDTGSTQHIKGKVWCKRCKKVCPELQEYRCNCGHFSNAHTDDIPESFSIKSTSSDKKPVNTTFTKIIVQKSEELPPSVPLLMTCNTAPIKNRALSKSVTEPSGLARARKNRQQRNYMTLGRSQSKSISVKPRITRRRSSFAINSPAAAVLAWARSCADPLGIRIKNLHSAWQDGRAFAAIVEPWAPELINAAEMDPENGLENLKKALKVAEDLGVNVLVDAEDIFQWPDKKCIMLQLSNHMSVLTKLPKKKTADGE